MVDIFEDNDAYVYQMLPYASVLENIETNMKKRKIFMKIELVWHESDDNFSVDEIKVFLAPNLD